MTFPKLVGSTSEVLTMCARCASEVGSVTVGYPSIPLLDELGFRERLVKQRPVGLLPRERGRRESDVRRVRRQPRREHPAGIGGMARPPILLRAGGETRPDRILVDIPETRQCVRLISNQLRAIASHPDRSAACVL